MARLVTRDPFARAELWSERVYDQHAVCKFCGDVRTTPNGRRYLFHYQIRHDGGLVVDTSREFCSKQCWIFWNGG